MTAPFEITEEQIADCYGIATTSRLIHELVDELDHESFVLINDDEYVLHESDLIVWSVLEEINRKLGIVRTTLARKLAESMPDKTVTVEGAGVYEKHKKTDRKRWDKDLLRAVLDTRLVDPETGEVKDPTPLDKVLDVWNLGTPRVTALRARGLDPDEWCEHEDAGLTLQFKESA